VRVTLEPEEIERVRDYIETYGLCNIDRIEITEDDIKVFLREDKNNAPQEENR